MAIKNLKFELKLFVDNKLVADSTDFALWQSVYRILSKNDVQNGDIKINAELINKNVINELSDNDNDESIDKYAKMLDINESTLKGACDPENKEPYIHIDMHFWSDWVKNIPKRGPGSTGPIALAATLLCLWFHNAGLGEVTLKHSQKVLNEIGLTDTHPSRSINNCSWLQLRNGKKIQLNASAIDKAVEVAKAFCERRKPNVKEK